MPCSKASPCLIVLAHNEAKIVCLVPRLPLGGGALPDRAVVRGSSVYDAKKIKHKKAPFFEKRDFFMPQFNKSFF